jgi:hypothetical protein
MADGPISKIDGAGLQLECALRLVDSGNDVFAHALAYNAYCLLRDLLHADLDKFERAMRIRVIAEFLKHGKTDPYDVLTKHSAETVYLLLLAAIALWEQNDQELTDAMREFSARHIPYESGYRHNAAAESLQQGSFPDAASMLTKPSTDLNIQRGPRGKHKSR